MPSRAHRAVDILGAIFLVVVVVAIPAFAIAYGIGLPVARAAKITAFACSMYLSFCVAMALVIRIPPVRRALEREIDLESRAMRILVLTAALAARDPAARALVNRHYRERDAAKRRGDDESAA